MGQNASASPREEMKRDAPINSGDGQIGGDDRSDTNNDSTVEGTRISSINNSAPFLVFRPGKDTIGTQNPQPMQSRSIQYLQPTMRQLPYDFGSPAPMTSDEDEAIKCAMKNIAKSFSPIHRRLLDLAIGKCTIRQDLAICLPPGPLSPHHLRSMAAMAEMEFLESLKKELEFPEEQELSDPLPFDIFLMEPTLSRQGQLAICVPTRKKKGEQTKKMMWYDGQGLLWDITPPTHVRKVASLSGTVRIIEALTHPVTRLMEYSMTRKMIVDSEDVRKATQKIFEIALNNSQEDAVATVLSPDFDEGLFCVLGPPGTGKTHTINAMIQSIGQGIVVAAPSNAAVANLANKVHSSAYFNLEKIVVYGQNCDESVRFLNPLHRSEEFHKFMKLYNNLADDNEARDQERKKFASWLRLDQGSTILDFAKLCPYIDLEELSGRKLHNAILGSASVIFCTLNSSGSNMLRKAVGKAFETYILDEAGQCPESEYYIGTTFPGIKRMIVVGDPQQLPPCVIDQRCSERGYGVSWLKRIYDQFPQKVHLLDTQYRMDRAIIKFPNTQFYNKRIISGDNVVGREPHVLKPIQFVDTKRRGREERNQFSWKNEYEAVVVKSILNTDEDIVKLRASSRHTRVIVITPYRAQVSLLTDKLKNMRGVEVATVDRFQGQEADIVILSTVRTKNPGFVDDSQRLNVALTRAKRVLRIVGDLSFFLSLKTESTLKSLATFYNRRRLICEAKVQSIAWTSPDWGCCNLWIPTMTSRFHHSIKEMSSHSKNVCFNTLLAVSKPDIKLLAPRPAERDHPSWYVTSLSGYHHHLAIVWIAKVRGADLIIEAHFAGTRDSCNHFIQKHANAPAGACVVRPDLSGVLLVTDDSKKEITKDLITAWPLTNPLQNAIISSCIDSLPQGHLVLDPHQEEIAISSPPLLIESRSGTGKTNVLFQNAVIHTQLEQQQSPGCFVTVSPRLCKELKQRYEEIRVIENDGVPKFIFFSRADLLRGLLTTLNIDNINMDRLCSFREYCKERARITHTRSVIEEKLTENEIGGVILGSLSAGIKQRPLSREEYLEEIRSNISNKTRQGQSIRETVYDEYTKYRTWKIQRDRHDIDDVVLMLLKDPSLTQIFDSAYIDEVQDFSYAALLLICTIGGAQQLKWIFAGDTAQMISPGCSFTFNGLKQTLLHLQPGIESKLSKVSHLLVNYRTTKDILLLGNSILSVAKNYFSDQIPHSLPEVAMKDLGLKVRICCFDDATSLDVKFGHNQALIHSSEDSNDYNSSSAVELRQWLNDHPFILTSLDSKGLEFDDVVVAFEFGRGVWDVAMRRVESLRMLRELYVAVTRAKRRVVILLRRKDRAMKAFLDSLNCDIETIKDRNQFQVEFDCETSTETWQQKGLELFEDGHFRLAASCFAAANDWSLSNWSEAKHLASIGNRSEAACAYRRAARCFFEDSKYKHVLDVLQELSYCPPWDENDNPLFDAALAAVPTHFSRHEKVRLLLVRNCWEKIEVRDLKDPDTSPLFVSRQDSPELKSIIKECQEEDRLEIGNVLPAIVADYYLAIQNYSSAVSFYIQGKKINDAIQATKSAVQAVRTTDYHVFEIVKFWIANRQPRRSFSEESYVGLLIRLYTLPLDVAESSGRKCLQAFGRRVIMFALEHNRLEPISLYHFHPNEFRNEVNTCLEKKLSQCIGIVQWYIDKKDYENANEYVQSRWKKTSNRELVDIISLDRNIRPGNLLPELKRRKLLIDAICQAFLPQSTLDEAISASAVELSTLKENIPLDAERLRGLVKLNPRHFEHNESFFQLQDSSVSNFLDLCRDPYYAITTLKAKCAKFGKDRILKAVSYGGPFEEDALVFLLNFSTKYFKKTSKYNLLVNFYNGNKESANWYAELNRENWTNKELIDLVDVLGLQPFPIGVEFLRRGMCGKALYYALASQDDKTATEASIAMLKSPPEAEKNIIKVLTSWKESKPGMPSDFIQSLLSSVAKSSKYEDEMTALLKSFGPIVFAFLKIYASHGNLDKSILNLIIAHNMQLRKRMVHVASKIEATNREDEYLSETTALVSTYDGSTSGLVVQQSSESKSKTQTGKKKNKKKGKNKRR